MSMPVYACARRNASALTMVAIGSAFLALAGCGGGGSGDSKSQTGMLKIGVTDSPVDAADAVVVQFTGVELKPVNGQAFSRDFSSPKTIDLLTLQGTNRAMLLDGESVPAGDYEWMRLKVNADPNVVDSYITVGGAQCEMRIPSGDETGLKMIRGFTVGVGTTTDFTIDFNLRQSIVRPPGQQAMTESCGGQAYMLKPVLRVVDNLQVGTLTGTVDPTLVSTQCTDASTVAQVAPGNVYLFGPYATGTTPPVPDDVDANDADGLDPLASAMVKVDGSGNNTYTIGFVPAGNYVLAYTCSPDQPDVDADAADTPTGADEVVTFTPATGVPDVVVTANQTTTQNFGP